MLHDGNDKSSGPEAGERVASDDVGVLSDPAGDSSDKVKRLVQIGRALSAEKDLNRLLEMIVDNAMDFTNADGGTLYIMSDHSEELQFAIIQNDTLNIRMGGTGGQIGWSPVKLTNSDGSPNHANVSAYAALSGQVANIPDVYDAEGFNFEGTRKFDEGTGYRSRSMLVVPMRDHENDIIGVLQLLNARDWVTGEVGEFSLESQSMTEALASQAAVALTNNRLIRDLEHLLESFIKSIATAIDQKSPYTGGHVRRVAELALMIAEKLNNADQGVYADTHLNAAEIKELRIAAWLHDVGKITTPEHVVDKATKLETVHDRIEPLRVRFELLKKEREVALLRASLEGSRGAIPPAEALHGDPEFSDALREELDFLFTVNTGAEYMSDESIARLKVIGARKYVIDGNEEPLLSDDEIRNLSIRVGTLNDKEREIINNHAAVTYKILSELPFPKKLRHVAEYAAAHHEKLNGTGYPNHLKGDQLPIQARILALSDIFEALTAKDRPYKKGKTLSEALKIMSFMAKDGHIDPDLFDLFMKERIYADYARKELEPQQIDILES